MLAAVALHHSCNDGSVVILPSIFPLLYTQGKLISDYGDIGNTIILGLAVAVVSQGLIGHFAKPRQTRWYLALDALLVGISLLLLTLATNFWMLVLFFIGIRLGTSIYHPVGIAWVSHSFQGKQMDRSMGIQSAFGNIGVLLAFTSTGIIADSFGWKAPLYVWGVINLAAVAAGLMLSSRTVSLEDIAEQKETEKEAISWKEAFRAVGVFIPMMLLGGLAWGVIINYSPSLLNHRLGLSMSTTGIILGCWMCAGTISALMYGKTAGRLGRGRTLLLAYLIITEASFTLAIGKSLFAILLAFTLCGLALFVTYPAILSFISVVIGPRNRTAGFALSANVAIAGNSIFAYISGHISDVFGIQAPFLLLGSVTSVIVCYMIIMILKGRIREDGRAEA